MRLRVSFNSNTNLSHFVAEWSERSTSTATIRVEGESCEVTCQSEEEEKQVQDLAMDYSGQVEEAPPSFSF